MQRIGYGRKSKETRHKYKREDDGTRNERGCYMQNVAALFKFVFLT